MVAVPPHDLDAERAVLGAMLVSEAALAVCAEKLKAQDFYSEVHRHVFDAALALYASGEPVDGMTIASELSGRSWAADREYVFKLVESFPTAANASHYADVVKDRAILRSLLDASDRIRQDAYVAHNDSTGAIERSEHEIYRISSGLERDAKGALEPAAALVGEVLDHVQELYEKGGDVAGLELGFYDLDHQLGGCHEGDLVFLAGRPAMGKTSLALAAAMNVADQGFAVPIFSLEMSKTQLMQRLISIRSDVPLASIRNGQLSDAEYSRVVKASAEIASLPLHIDDTSDISVPSIRSRLRRLHSRLRAKGQGMGLIVVDYIGLISSSSRTAKNRNDEITDISRSLKILAKDFSVPVLTVAQLSRACEQRADKRPLLSDLRESGSQEQDADIVMFLYRDEVYNPDSDHRGTAEVIVAKHRNGPTGKVDLSWISRCAKFASLARDARFVAGRAC